MTLGIEPNHFEEKHLELLEERAKKTELWEPLHYLLKRREQLSRQFSRVVYRRGMEPKELFDWIELVQLNIHPEFTSRYLGSKVTSSSIGREEKRHKTDQRETDSIAQLFAAIAIEQLGYVPDAPRSPIPKEIAEIAASMGLNISDDTVRKYLKRGAGFRPPDWKPN